ncbi:MAG: ACT domain-containing protein [Oscillospiraceae bacterium]|nr:ACT domain-containing protein [Oscillospiraceae bacterium]MBP1575565.1 ACT domain-containing protein [Oscillospiraceae bacterium]MBQ5322036.1 ACT domain-containing protein [Oscillospiraceae bacterium]MBQ8595195.1 ACT domain-containing protein [Oscillospiraceae bacterium]
MNENPVKIIVDADLLPEVLLKVIEAKKMLSQGKAKNSSEAARLAGISRSAFYKYKDGVAVYNDESRDKIVNYYMTLMDKPGVLSNVLAILSKYGANVLTLNQNIPIDGASPCTISFTTGNLKCDGHTLREAIRAIDGVITCRNLKERK